MRKTFLTLALYTSAANAEMFNGPAVGLTLGKQFTKSTIKLIEEGRPIGETRLFKNPTLFGIHLDYDMSKVNGFYSGIGLSILARPGHKTSAMKSHLPDYDFSKNHTTVKYSPDVQLDGRFGYNFAGQAIVYTLLGLKLQREKLVMKNMRTNRVIMSANRRYVIPCVGVGAKLKLTKNFSTGLEYRYSLRREDTMPTPWPAVHHLKYSNKSSSVLMKLTYHM
jgi:opacity protein-like surface antigen